ncbi:DUF4211 domain-containing protein [Frankia sp. R82]|uniref:DUF4211 domain-containing protein n=1 Tax=Frankia sp. R82 TaxID=2950553 RepID=UPI0020442377|nr:DUF4211 domain-containing protein [Frankia sp. R82]MCM3883153.1 DUF4211 domain-containing protein [Frankia sp. R82]
MGGTPTADDIADARALLQVLHGGVNGVSDAFQNAAPWDHLSPGYDPDRLVRILTALQAMIPAEITRWRDRLITPLEAREVWKSLLFSDACRACERHCHTCYRLADALGYERDGDLRVWRQRPEHPDAPQT